MRRRRKEVEARRNEDEAQKRDEEIRRNNHNGIALAAVMLEHLEKLGFHHENEVFQGLSNAARLELVHRLKSQRHLRLPIYPEFGYLGTPYLRVFALLRLACVH